MNDRDDRLEPKVGDENRGTAIFLYVVGLIFLVLLVVAYIVGKA